MSLDSGSRETRKPQRDWWELPKIRELHIRLIPYKAPERRFIKSIFAQYTEAIEFTVITDSSLPVRALSPILYVGDEPVTEGFTTEKDNVYRFLAFEFERFKEGAPISLGWPGQDTPRQETPFRFSLDENRSKPE